MRVNTITKVAVAGGVVGIGCFACLWQRVLKREAKRLTTILGWR